MIADPHPAGQLAPRFAPRLSRPSPLLVLAGYAAVFGFLARRLFRWE